MMKTISLYAGLLLLAFFSSASVATEKDAPDFVAIQSYARLAGASYAGESAIKKELAAQHYVLDKLIDVPGFLVSGFVASNKATKTQVIVVRGTANEENAFVDIALKLLPDEKTGVKLHQGFSKSASDFYQKALPSLHKNYHIITVGHSLGGAVAVILAMYLDVDHFNVEKVVTFGQPKVTNVTGARKFADINLTRVVTPKDVVPLVPPLDPMDIMKLDIYWHMGREIVLLDNHEYAVLEGVKSMMRISRFTSVVPDESNLQHHMMTEYLRRIADEIPKAKQVPYDTGFNLFGGS
jgi:triacylglycerol lipase